LRRAPKGNTQPNIEAAISTNLGDWKTAFDMDVGGGPGYRTAVIEKRDQNQLLEFSSNEIFKDTGRWFFANGEGSTETLKGTLTLNGRVGGDKREADTTRDIYNHRLPDSSPRDQFRSIAENNKFKMAEFGIDWAGHAGDWKLHLIGLGLVEDRHYKNQVNFENFTDPEVSQSSFEKDSLKTEFIGRFTHGYTGTKKFKPEYGIELAQNKLTSDSSSLENGSLVNISGNNVKVEEIRSEIFATFVYQHNKDLTIEGGLTSEFSQIEVSGEFNNKRTFEYIKPRLSTTYKLNSSSQIALVAERRIGQLNFNDFAASDQAADGTITSGNPNLAPDTTDELSATYDWSFSEKGSLTVKLFHEWRQDILEQIVLPSGGNGIGNAGDAKFWGLITDINLPLDAILENGLIEISHRYRDSSFDDPVTNSERVINGYTPNWLSFKLRQDLVESQLAWGIEYWGSFTDTFYLVEERQTFSGNKRIRAFIETSRFLGVKMQLEVTHLNTGEYTRY